MYNIILVTVDYAICTMLFTVGETPTVVFFFLGIFHLGPANFGNHPS